MLSLSKKSDTYLECLIDHLRELELELEVENRVVFLNFFGLFVCLFFS